MKRKIFTSLAAAGLLACTIATASAAEQSPRWFCTDWRNPCHELQLPEPIPVVSETPVQSSIGTMSGLEQDACKLVNQMRQKHGLQPLTVDADLSAKARIKSKDMKVNNYFSHKSPTYGSPFSMMKNLGIRYQSAGENIAMGYTSANAVVNAWMNSESHRSNILSAKYASMGIGYVNGYWTQWFIG